ncbi:hypothetical protein GGI21_003712, partial [Coemansia aciculifera]
MSAEERGNAHSENAAPSSASARTVSAEAASQSPLGPRGGSTSQPFLTETSPLPIRSSTARLHSVSARSSPYTVSHSPRTHLGGDAANIPRTAQYHAVGTPARHPLGLQSEAVGSDLAVNGLASEVVDRRSPISMATALPRLLPLPTRRQESGSESGNVAATTHHARSGSLTPLGIDNDDDNDEGEFEM